MPKVKKLKRALAHDTRVFQKYRNLLMELTRKNIKLKYRDSWIGILWSFFAAAAEHDRAFRGVQRNLWPQQQGRDLLPGIPVYRPVDV